jgi:hypothetical protein
MTPTLLPLLQQNTSTLINQLHQYNLLSFNQKPADGKWSAREIAEHLLLLDQKLNVILSTTPIDPERDPQQKVSLIQTALLNRTNAYTAPTYLLPTGPDQEPATIAQQILTEREKIMAYTTANDMNLLYHEVKHPMLGRLTGVEWIHFLIVHTERHLEQMRELLQPS